MRARLIIVAAALAAAFRAGSAAHGAERVHLDEAGVVRWVADDREVALFGANYCLPSASDYRAAGYVGADRKKLVERDMTHFARMGWDGLRLALWGDWENSDPEGNLLVNEHLDLMDFLVFQAKRRGISMLFTPIHTHSALWPDGRDSAGVRGFSKHFPRDRMGLDPAAIGAQRNYLRQILRHVNPYTGIALKDEPAILFIELINEPWHHADDFSGSVAYINALVDAVRETGCEKILFHNLSQDFRMAPAIVASKAQGFSFGWYPTALVAGRVLTDNYLRWVDDYPPLDDPALAGMPRIVYEFDSADMVSPVMYPAMARVFRGAGAQFAAMFAYDMLETAPYNLGWQTHFLNLVYSPKKAVSAIIAAEAMRVLPRFERYGAYPSNLRFGPFELTADPGGVATMMTAEVFMHAGDVLDDAPEPGGLRRIVGCGRSALVDYEGNGAYFLDRLEEGVWRLELYPDAVLARDPFARKLEWEEVSSRLIAHAWPMQIRLPDLGRVFEIAPLDAGNTHRARAEDGRFEARPGVYLLTRAGLGRPASLPEQVGRVGLREFVCPPAPELPAQIVSHVREEFVAGDVARFEIDVLAADLPREVVLHARVGGAGEFAGVSMTRERGYRYRIDVPTEEHRRGELEWFFSVDTGEGVARFPADAKQVWTTRLVDASAPVALFDPARDGSRLFYSRADDRIGPGLFANLPAMGRLPARLRFAPPAESRRIAGEQRVACSARDRIGCRGERAGAARAVRVRAVGAGDCRRMSVVLIESDGMSWSAPIELQPEWRDFEIPLDAFRPGGGVKLPVGYPGRWNVDLPPPEGRGGAGDRLRIEHVEHVQLAFPPSGEEAPMAEGSAVEVAEVTLVF